MARLTVVDAAAPAAAACSVELEPGATLDDLHTLCLSLALPSAAAALRAEEQQLVICHDGRKLYRENRGQIQRSSWPACCSRHP